MSVFQKVMLFLVILGGLNWGVVGIWGFDLVSWICGGTGSWLARAIFLVIALAALLLLPALFAPCGQEPKAEPNEP